MRADPNTNGDSWQMSDNNQLRQTHATDRGSRPSENVLLTRRTEQNRVIRSGGRSERGFGIVCANRSTSEDTSSVAFALGFWRECGEKWKGEGTYVHLDGTASGLWLSSFTTTTEPPMVRKGSVLRRLAQSQRKELIQIVYLDVKTRAHGKQEISVIGLLGSSSSSVSVRSCGGLYSRGPDRFLLTDSCFVHLSTPSSASATGGSLVWFTHPARMSSPWSSEATPASRSYSPIGNFPRWSAWALTVSPRDLLNTLSTVRLPSLQRFDVQGTDTVPCVEACIKAHGYELIVLKVDLSIRCLFVAICSNASTWIIDDDGSRNGFQWIASVIMASIHALREWKVPQSQLTTIAILGAPPGPNAIEALLEIGLASMAPKLKRFKVVNLRWPKTRCVSL
ncbi:hypothetical protein BKA70DRAFT_1471513 [Coprinopsis sp. MPI-PUGE-AT-0042]|nr:hypothetical protein BKA70DRAFT_1471513 [Coprinopsis sp. MPI-PUGE-AT-0042]